MFNLRETRREGWGEGVVPYSSEEGGACTRFYQWRGGMPFFP